MDNMMISMEQNQSIDNSDANNTTTTYDLTKKDIVELKNMFYKTVYEIFVKYSKINPLVMDFMESFIYEHIAYIVTKKKTCNKYTIYSYLNSYITHHAHMFCQYWCYGEVAYQKKIQLKKRIKDLKDQDPSLLINDMADILQKEGWHKNNIKKHVEDFQVVYLSDKINKNDDDNNKIELIDSIQSEDSVAPENVIKNERYYVLTKVIGECLTKQEQFVITERYLQGDIKTLEQIAKQLAVTRERVTIIEKNALEKLHNAFIKKGIEFNDLI